MARSLAVALITVPFRVSPDAWEAIQLEAAHLGISANEFLRTAGIAYAAFALARRGGRAPDTLAELLDTANRFAAVWPDYP